MPEFPIVDLTDDETALTPDQQRRVTLAEKAATMLRGRPGAFGAAPAVHAEDVAWLATYLERGTPTPYHIHHHGRHETWEPVPGTEGVDLHDLHPEVPVDPTPDGLIIVDARDLRAGDRSPEWTVKERLAVEPEVPLGVGPSMDRVEVSVETVGGLREPRSFEPDEKIALIERGLIPGVRAGDPDPDIAPRPDPDTEG